MVHLTKRKHRNIMEIDKKEIYKGKCKKRSKAYKNNNQKQYDGNY